MVFLISLVVLIVLIILAVIGDKRNWNWDTVDNIELVALIYGLIWAIINIVVFVNFYSMTTPWGRSYLDARYNELCRNKDNKYLVSEIVDWNTDLSIYKSLQNDPWVGIYIPNIFDEYDYVK